jgi:tetratricopeptide (TPR) repeat protein
MRRWTPEDAQGLIKRARERAACGEFSESQQCLHAALRRLNPESESSLYFEACYRLGQVHQRRGRHSNAIVIFHALVSADHRHWIRYRYGIGVSYIALRDTAQARSQLNRILGAYANNTRDGWYYASRLALSACHSMQKEFREALDILAELIRDDEANAPTYSERMQCQQRRLLDELATEGGRHLRTPEPDRSQPLEVSGDEELCRPIRAILHRFPEIRVPLRAVYVERNTNNRKKLHDLGVLTSFVPISQGHRAPQSHVLIYNREFWRGASDAALRGNLAHELMHRAWEDAGADLVFFDWTANSLAYGCLEKIIDLCLLARGFAEDVYHSKAFIETKRPKEMAIDLSVGEIEDLLLAASRFEMQGCDSNVPRFELPESIRDRVEATWPRTGNDVLPEAPVPPR